MYLDPKRIEVIDEQVAEILRKQTPAQRLKTALGLWDMASKMIKSNLKSKHPEWSEEQVQKEVAHRMSHGAV